jgi:hypothetical protein
MYKLLILLSSFFLLTGQTCKQKNGGQDADCKFMGTIKDFQGLDGCGYMIVLENGEKLQPVKYASENLEIKDGQKIKFSYQEVTNQVGICMAGKMVEINCIEFLDDDSTIPPGTGGIKPERIKCVETLSPYDAEWMVISMEKTNAYQVVRYVYRTDGFAYYFLGPTKNMLFDCQGTLLCESNSRETKCDDKTKQYSDELVIWEKD